MYDAYQNALRTVADSYETEVTRWGGKSLSRVATIVVSSGAFFNRVRDGKTFSVATLEKFASWFRVPANWPDHAIPREAVVALTSIGRPPLLTDTMPHSYGTNDASVAFDRASVLKRTEA